MIDLRPWREVVQLVLEGVRLRSTDYRSLEEYLERRLGFRRVEGDEVVLRTLRLETAGEHAEITVERGFETTVYAGYFMGVDVLAEFLGEEEKGMEVVSVDGEEFNVFTSAYKMVKFSSVSGYVLQRLLEELVVDLGIQYSRKDWTFHRIVEEAT
ncbi:MAG: hypothetical protein QXP94_02400 [Thermofilaceae archaeon]